jgi:ribonuclease P protein component
MKKRADFLAARDGPKTGARAFLVVKRARGDGDSLVRAGFTVTKKLGKAVLRNRIKRRLREACRRALPLHAEAGCDYVLIARAAAADLEFQEMIDDLQRALKILARAQR